ncbi:MAG: hypothetical protein MJ223_00120 [Mycoplasmoidaceae bacterium]|nr:hypothetical protein [Mycoplasmoidaceae bacterium]
MYTKVAITVYILVAIIGVAGAIGTEFMNPYAQSNIPIGMYKGKEILMRDITIVGNQNQFGEFGSNPEANKIFAIIFHSFNSRSLGMETVKTSVLFEGTK